MDDGYFLNFCSKYGYVDSAVLHTALRLGLFAQLPLAPAAACPMPQLAQQLGVSLRGTRVLLEPLVGSGLLLRDADDGLALHPDLAPLHHDPSYIAALAQALPWWTVVPALPQAVRSAAPVHDAHGSWDLLAHYQTLFASPPPADAPATALLFDRVARHFLRTQALICAADLQLFDQLSATPQSLAALSAATQTAPAGLAVLLHTLHQMGVLLATDDGYAYPPTLVQLCQPRQRQTFVQGLQLVRQFWEALGRLDEAVLYDRRSLDLHSPDLSSAYYLALARYNTSLFPAYFQLIRSVPATLRELRLLPQARVLDVGAGSGVWGAAFAHGAPEVQVTFLDQPQVLEQTRRNIARVQLDAQAQFWAADLLSADYGQATFDIIILAQICHTQHPEHVPDLLGRLARALRPGGWLVLADSILNEHRNGPIEYLYFAVREFIATQGDILSVPEYARLLASAGLNASPCYRLNGIDVILACCETVSFPASLVAHSLGASATKASARMEERSG